jgi:hypothetical protein
MLRKLVSGDAVLRPHWPDCHHRNSTTGLEARIGAVSGPPVRTLDAIHLAAIEFIRSQGASVQLASYDERLIDIARLLGIPEWNA